MSLAGPVVQPVLNPPKSCASEACKAGEFRQVLSNQSVGVLAGSPLLGAGWFGEVGLSIQLLAGLGIEARRFAPHTGAWVGDEKVAAIGVKIRKWVSLHGIALNCSNDLKEFGLIIPCGISNYGVTSVSRLLHRTFSVEEAKPLATRAFESVFGLNFG